MSIPAPQVSESQLSLSTVLQVSSPDDFVQSLNALVKRESPQYIAKGLMNVKANKLRELISCQGLSTRTVMAITSEVQRRDIEGFDGKLKTLTEKVKVCKDKISICGKQIEKIKKLQEEQGQQIKQLTEKHLLDSNRLEEDKTKLKLLHEKFDASTKNVEKEKLANAIQDEKLTELTGKTEEIDAKLKEEEQELKELKKKADLQLEEDIAQNEQIAKGGKVTAYIGIAGSACFAIVSIVVPPTVVVTIPLAYFFGGTAMCGGLASTFTWIRGNVLGKISEKMKKLKQ